MIQNDIRLPHFRQRTIKGLMVSRPLQDIVKVATHVHSIEDREHIQVFVFSLDPSLAEGTDVAGALELLADDVHAVINVKADDGLTILVYPRTLVSVIVDIPWQRLADHVQTMQMMQDFDVGEVAATLVCSDFYC